MSAFCRYKKRSKTLKQLYIDYAGSEAVDASLRDVWLNLVEAAARQSSTESDLDDAMLVIPHFNILRSLYSAAFAIITQH